MVPGVEVTATNIATNIPSLAISNDRGDYILDKLNAGTYDLKAELPGFKTQLSQGIVLAQTQVARIDFVMTPGEIAEQVTVTGQSTVIDTDTAEVSSVIEEKKILDLPLRGRDMVKLAYLTTGGTQENQKTGYTSLYSYGGGYPSFNGLYAHSNQIMLDGANNMGYITQRPTGDTGDGAGVQGHHQQLLGRVRTSGWRGHQHAFQEWIQRVPRAWLVVLPR